MHPRGAVALPGPVVHLAELGEQISVVAGAVTDRDGHLHQLFLEQRYAERPLEDRERKG